MTAHNYYGDSLMSSTGNGAIIVYVPDAPLNLADVLSITNDAQVGLVWTNGVSNGGTAVIDYVVQYD